jgi:hypothetical protein
MLGALPRCQGGAAGEVKPGENRGERRGYSLPKRSWMRESSATAIL